MGVTSPLRETLLLHVFIPTLSLKSGPLLKQQPLVSGWCPALVSSVGTGPGADGGQEVVHRPSLPGDSDSGPRGQTWV